MSYSLFIWFALTLGGLKLSVHSDQSWKAQLGEEDVWVDVFDIFLSWAVFSEFCRLHLPWSCCFGASRARPRRRVGLRHRYFRTGRLRSATAFVQVGLEVVAEALKLRVGGLVCEQLAFAFGGCLLLHSMFGSPWTPLHFGWGAARLAGRWRRWRLWSLPADQVREFARPFPGQDGTGLRSGSGCRRGALGFESHGQYVEFEELARGRFCRRGRL